MVKYEFMRAHGKGSEGQSKTRGACFKGYKGDTRGPITPTSRDRASK